MLLPATSDTDFLSGIADACGNGKVARRPPVVGPNILEPSGRRCIQKTGACSFDLRYRSPHASDSFHTISALARSGRWSLASARACYAERLGREVMCWDMELTARRRS